MEIYIALSAKITYMIENLLRLVQLTDSKKLSMYF